MASVIVIGAGMVGATIALDLAERHEVTATDRSSEALGALAEEADRRGIRFLRTEPLDAVDRDAVRAAVRGFDLAVSAVPGFIGRRVLQNLIEAEIPVADISFGPEDVLDLDARARERGVCALVDIGVAPGLASVILGHHDAEWLVTEFACLVGGLPAVPTWPWHYKAPFSPTDVIEEYLRPARQMEGGRVVVREALSDPELVEFPGIGTLEAFNTDGLRSLLTTMAHVPSMREKTLRWPGHRDLAHALRESGLLSAEPMTTVDAAGVAVQVAPRAVTERLLFEQWTLAPGEAEFTAMEVTVRGTDRQSGEPRSATYRLLDRTDPLTGTSSMARTTGYTCVAAAECLLDGFYREPGVHPGEHLGAVPGALDRILGELAARGVIVTREDAAAGA